MKKFLKFNKHKVGARLLSLALIAATGGKSEVKQEVEKIGYRALQKKLKALDLNAGGKYEVLLARYQEATQ